MRTPAFEVVNLMFRKVARSYIARFGKSRSDPDFNMTCFVEIS